MRPPVIDGIEELDQDSKLDNALHIEELDRAGQHRGARLPRIRHAIISFGLPYEPEDSQYGEYRLISLRLTLHRVRSIDTHISHINPSGRAVISNITT